MSRNADIYMSQLIWETEEKMGNKITFFKGEMAVRPCPELKFNGHVLIPFDTRWDGSTVTLYYSPDTTLPANPMTFSEQLLDQNYILCGYGKNEVGNFVFVRAVLRGQS